VLGEEVVEPLAEPGVRPPGDFVPPEHAQAPAERPNVPPPNDVVREKARQLPRPLPSRPRRASRRRDRVGLRRSA
jgi:hypothetical protein